LIYHPLAVVITHVHKYWKKRGNVTRKCKSGWLYERHVVATWKLGNHHSIRLYTQGNQEKTVPRWKKDILRILHTYFQNESWGRYFLMVNSPYKEERMNSN